MICDSELLLQRDTSEGRPYSVCFRTDAGGSPPPRPRPTPKKATRNAPATSKPAPKPPAAVGRTSGQVTASRKRFARTGSTQALQGVVNNQKKYRGALVEHRTRIRRGGVRADERAGYRTVNRQITTVETQIKADTRMLDTQRRVIRSGSMTGSQVAARNRALADGTLQTGERKYFAGGRNKKGNDTLLASWEQRGKALERQGDRNGNVSEGRAARSTRLATTQAQIGNATDGRAYTGRDVSALDSAPGNAFPGQGRLDRLKTRESELGTDIARDDNELSLRGQLREAESSGDFRRAKQLRDEIGGLQTMRSQTLQTRGAAGEDPAKKDSKEVGGWTRASIQTANDARADQTLLQAQTRLDGKGGRDSQPGENDRENGDYINKALSDGTLSDGEKKKIKDMNLKPEDLRAYLDALEQRQTTVFNRANSSSSARTDTSGFNTARSGLRGLLALDNELLRQNPTPYSRGELERRLTANHNAAADLLGDNAVSTQRATKTALTSAESAGDVGSARRVRAGYLNALRDERRALLERGVKPDDERVTRLDDRIAGVDRAVDADDALLKTRVGKDGPQLTEQQIATYGAALADGTVSKDERKLFGSSAGRAYLNAIQTRLGLQVKAGERSGDIEGTLQAREQLRASHAAEVQDALQRTRSGSPESREAARDDLTAARRKLRKLDDAVVEDRRAARDAAAAAEQPQAYEIQQGDTLTAIAEQNDTTIEAIVEANDEVIEDPDLIYSGVELQMPDPG